MASRLDEWSETSTGSEQWADAMTQMLRLPFAMLTAGMGLFGQMLSGVQGLATGGTDYTARRDPPGASERPSRLPLSLPNPPVPAPPQAPAPRRTPAQGETQSSKPVEGDESKPNPPGVLSGAALQEPKETVMSCCDTNLSDDMLKLVQYSIVCITRDHESVLVCNQCKIFSDNMTDCDFDSWVIADYVASQCREIEIHGKEKCESVIPCKRKDLRVSFCVLGRWPQQDLQYEEKELRRLAGIEHAIRDLNRDHHHHIVRGDDD